MTNFEVGVLVWLGILLGRMSGYLRTAFYRGYFYQKQKNLGEDPEAVIRSQFPRFWWFIK